MFAAYIIRRINNNVHLVYRDSKNDLGAVVPKLTARINVSDTEYQLIN